MAKKVLNNTYVLAARNLDGVLSELGKGLLRMPGKAEDYRALFSSASLSLKDMKGLGRFIKKMGLSKGECGMYWEALVTDGFTLYAIESGMRDTQLAELCDGKNIKFLATARI